MVLGLTFKENVKDTRNSKIKETIKKLKEQGIDVYGLDPLLSKEEIEHFEAKELPDLETASQMDGVILSILHNEFRTLTLEKMKKIMSENPVLVDIKSYFLRHNPQTQGFIYKAL